MNLAADEGALGEHQRVALTHRPDPQPPCSRNHARSSSVRREPGTSRQVERLRDREVPRFAIGPDAVVRRAHLEAVVPARQPCVRRHSVASRRGPTRGRSPRADSGSAVSRRRSGCSPSTRFQGSARPTANEGRARPPSPCRPPRRRRFGARPGAGFRAGCVDRSSRSRCQRRTTNRPSAPRAASARPCCLAISPCNPSEAS